MISYKERQNILREIMKDVAEYTHRKTLYSLLSKAFKAGAQSNQINP